MSSLTVAIDKGSKKPQYKDYVSFLGNYKSGRKDDQCSVATSDSGVSFSLNNSSNNSSSSINSDLTDTPRNGFKEYLEQYTSKKYSPVQPAFIKKQKPEEAKTIKTEVFIEIKDTHNAVNQISKVVELNTHNQTSNVSKVSKRFETNGSCNEPAQVKTVQPSGKVNTFKFDQIEVEAKSAIRQEQKKTSIGEISKKFEASSVNGSQKPPLKKTPSISEKSKLFEDINHVETNKHIVNGIYKQKENSNLSKTNGSTSPKPPIINIKPVLASKTLLDTSATIQLPPFHPPPPPPLLQNTCAPQKLPPFPTSPPSPPIQNICNPPKLPPFPTPPVPSFQDNSAAQNIPCPPPPPPSNVPPPPPPPPANFTPKISKPAPTTQKTLNNGPVQNGNKNDEVDGIAVPVIDKNDPRVKRIVYGALREMYGAYHDKANDYIATLPRNRVKKNNGLDSIINSIASQGGLEKLNGRVNPTVENE